MEYSREVVKNVHQLTLNMMGIVLVAHCFLTTTTTKENVFVIMDFLLTKMVFVSVVVKKIKFLMIILEGVNV